MNLYTFVRDVLERVQRKALLAIIQQPGEPFSITVAEDFNGAYDIAVIVTVAPKEVRS